MKSLFSRYKDKKKEEEKEKSAPTSPTAPRKDAPKSPTGQVADAPKSPAPNVKGASIKAHVLGTAEERDVLHEAGKLVVEIVEARNLVDRASEPDIVNPDYELKILVNDRKDADNNFLGMILLLPAWVPDKTYDGWYPLKSTDPLLAVSGEVHVRLTYKKADDKKLTVDDFELLTVIGKGSFGKVLQVRKKDTSRIYAMKILKKGHIIERDEVEHTKSERAILAKNNACPFLVGLKFSFQTPDKIYLVLDYINGGELFFHLQNEGIFSENRSRFYAAQLILGLEYLHKMDIVYRDLKPENILVDYTGYIALTDFGLCKEDVKHDDTTNTFCGTPEYMAPEVLQQKGYGREVDWWTIGVLLFEMMTGLPPYYDENTNQMYQKILYADLVFPETLSPNAKDIIAKLLNRDPKQRLGHGATDAEPIKAHPFFKSMNWDDMWHKRLVAPWRPHLSDKVDTSNFDAEFTSMTPKDSVVGDTPLSQTAQNQFTGFTYVDGGELTRP